MLIFRVATLATIGLASALLAQTSPVPPQQIADLGELRLESGAAIHGCNLGYRTLGTLDEAKSNAIVFPTWITGNSADLLRVVSVHLSKTGYFNKLLESQCGLPARFRGTS